MALLGAFLLLGLSPGCTDAFIESLTDRSVNELVDAIDDVLDAECECLAADTGDTGVDDLCNESIRLVFKATLARCLQAILNDHPEAEATYECATSAHTAQASCLNVAVCTDDLLESCESALEDALNACPPLPDYRNCLLGI
jgi:hypothetical protein